MPVDLFVAFKQRSCQHIESILLAVEGPYNETSPKTGDGTKTGFDPSYAQFTFFAPDGSGRTY